MKNATNLTKANKVKKLREKIADLLEQKAELKLDSERAVDDMEYARQDAASAGEQFGRDAEFIESEPDFDALEQSVSDVRQAWDEYSSCRYDNDNILHEIKIVDKKVKVLRLKLQSLRSAK